MPTLKDLQKETGLALSTISTVLNNKKTQIAISEKTKKVVWEAANRLGYTPNLVARSLRSRKSFNIGIAFASSFSEFKDPTASQVLSGIGSVFDRTEYNLLMFSGYEQMKERSLTAAKGHMVDAMLYIVYTAVYDYFHKELAPELKRAGIPFLGLQFYRKHRDKNCTALNVENAPALVCRHFADAGYEETVMIDFFGRQSNAGNELCSRFTEAAEAAGIARAEIIRPEDMIDIPSHAPHASYDRWFDIGYRLAGALHTAGQLQRSYFITSDIMAGGFIERLREAGIRIPEDVAVTGYGNHVRPGQGSGFLTTVDARYEDAGRIAAQTILEMLTDGTSAALTAPIILEPELIIRKSSATVADKNL